MPVADAGDFKALIPREEWIGFRAGSSQVSRRGTHQMADFKAAVSVAAPGLDVRTEWTKSAVAQRFLAAMQCPLVQSLGDHRDAVGPEGRGDRRRGWRCLR